MHSSEKRIRFDPCKVRFDLPLSEAFRLTQVRSFEDYMRLRLSLPTLRGQSYSFVNRLGDSARLMVTIIVADSREVTASFTLDHKALGIDYDELIGTAGLASGNYPLSPRVEEKVRKAIMQPDWRFFKAA